MNNPESEAQIRKLFIDWLAASSRKDIDAAMAPISETIVSYEHSMPLEVRDIAALREECLTGFERAGPGFEWSIPELKIIVRGGIAVTWGLNRMADYEGGDLKSEMWSRGTRIFQFIDGAWKMMHQHVSFPFDPATGMARIDLKPDLRG
jgi:ketosteroid isomerase-like protein